MSYFVEFSLDRDESFYQEIVIVNKRTGGLVPGFMNDHRLVDRRGAIIASNSNGMITTPIAGLIILDVPFSALRPAFDFAPIGYSEDPWWWGGSGCHGSRTATGCRLLCFPPDDPANVKEIFKATFSLGDR